MSSELSGQSERDERFQRALDTGLRYKRERDVARQRLATLDSLIRRASPFVNAVAVMAEDKAPALAWLADAATALPRTAGACERDA